MVTLVLGSLMQNHSNLIPVADDRTLGPQDNIVILSILSVVTTWPHA